MAQSVGAVALDIVMGKNTVSGVAKQAIADVQKTFNDASAGMGQKVSSVGSAVSAMGASMLPASTAVAGLGTSMVKTAANFDSAMSEVQAISGATGKDFEALRDKAQEMGAKTKFSASQSAEAMTYMAMAGWKTEDMLSGIEGVMNLAAASGEDLATTSDIVTDALTAFGLQASDSGHFADVLAAASSNANTNVAMMGETFKYVAPVAGAMGYSCEDMSVAIGLMANSGIKGSQAGTALRSTITRLAKPTKETQDAMDALGISITNQDGTMKSFNEIMLDMRSSFAGLTEEQKAQYAASLAGQEGMSGLLAIVNSSDADFNKLTSAINNADGTAQKMADTMNNNLNGQITLLKSQLEGLAIQLGEYLVPIVSNVVSAISKLADWFGNLDEGTKKMIVTIGLVVAAAAPVLLIVGKVITVIGGAISAIGTIGGAVSGFIGLITGTVIPALGSFFTFLAANPIVLIIGAIIAIGALLITHWEEVKQVAVAVWQAICDFITVIWEGIKSAITFAVNAIKTVITTVFEAIKAVITAYVNAWKAVITAVFNAIKTVVTTYINAVKTVITTVFEAIKAIFTTYVNAWKTVITTAFNAIKTIITTVLNAVKSVVTNVFSGIKSTIGNITSAIKNGLNNAFNFIKSIPRQALQWGKDMIMGIVNGIKSCIGAVGDAVKSIADKIRSFLHFSVPDEGPLTDYESWMPDFIGGMAKGIDNNKYKLIDAVKGMASEMTMPEMSAPVLKNVGGGGVAMQASYSGEDRLYGLLTQLIENMQNIGNITVPVYLGNDLIEEQIIRADDRRNIRSGGRV